MNHTMPQQLITHIFVEDVLDHINNLIHQGILQAGLAAQAHLARQVSGKK